MHCTPLKSLLLYTKTVQCLKHLKPSDCFCSASEPETMEQCVGRLLTVSFQTLLPNTAKCTNKSRKEILQSKEEQNYKDGRFIGYGTTYHWGSHQK